MDTNKYIIIIIIIRKGGTQLYSRAVQLRSRRVGLGSKSLRFIHTYSTQTKGLVRGGLAVFATLGRVVLD